MFKIKILKSFSAAHFLREYQGKCESLHGHNWKVEVIVSREELNETGMVVDFGILKKITVDTLEELDHKHINELEYFFDHNPSSENIAKFIYYKIGPQIKPYGAIIDQVRVWETDNSCAIYSE